MTHEDDLIELLLGCVKGLIMLEEILFPILLLLCGLLLLCHLLGNVFFTCGMIRVKSINTIILQNLSAFSLVFIIHLLIGHDIMHGNPVLHNSAATIFNYLLGLAPIETPHSKHALYAVQFFHALLPCISVAIIASMTAERLRLIPFLVFTLVLTIIIFPISAYWVWGRSWLMQFGFIDRSGTSLVYLIGSLAGLTGTLILGPRASKHPYQPLEACNIPLATQGMFLILLGCIGLNTGTYLLQNQDLSVENISLIFTNNCLAFSAGILANLILTRIVYRTSDLTLIFNGAIAGLVAIAPMPLYQSALPAISIGALAGFATFAVINLSNKLKIEDPTGAFGSFGIAAILGLCAVPTSRHFLAQLGIQIIGTSFISVWVILISAATWYAIKIAIGLGYSKSSQQHGLDILECGINAYPQFQIKSTQ